MTIDVDIDRIRNDAAKAVGHDLRETISARLGNPLTEEIEVAVGEGGSDIPGMVWVFDVEGGTGAPGQALNSGRGKLSRADLVYGRYIRIRPRGNGQPHIVDGLDDERDARYTRDVELREQTFVQHGQIDIALLKPTEPPSLKVVFTGGLVWFNGLPYLLGQRETTSVSGDLPSTDGAAKIKLVQVDPLTNTLSYKVGSEFNDNLTNVLAFEDYFPAPDTGKMVVGYLRLTKGITELLQGLQIVAAQPLVALSQNAGDASAITYTPSVNTNWDGNADPGETDDALNQLAARLKTIEGMPSAQRITSTFTQPTSTGAFYIAPVEITGSLTVNGSMYIL